MSNSTSQSNPSTSRLVQRVRSVLKIAAIGSLVLGATACAVTGSSRNQQAAQQPGQQPGAVPSPTREEMLAAALQMPDAALYQVQRFDWQDQKRQRQVQSKLYLPRLSAQERVPLVVVSHGIGGSREGYSYIGTYLAANGIASLHLQHEGSDRKVWFGNPLTMVGRLQEAAQDKEAVARAQDVSFAIDQALNTPELATRLDSQRIAAIGHSYGANTALLVSGATVERDGQSVQLSDTRIKASVLMSAPPFYGLGDPHTILGRISIPTLHITAMGDDIKIPGYFSGVNDRISVFDATGSAYAQSTNSRKVLAVFKDGSHSIFTDRLGTGGVQHNPKVKAATRELIYEFLAQTFKVPMIQAGNPSQPENWAVRHRDLVARFEQRG